MINKILLTLAALLSATLITTCIVLNQYAKSLPNQEILEKYNPPSITRIYGSDGNLLKEYSEEYRIFIPIGNVPTNLINAFIAAEDKNFFNNKGIEIMGIIRAAINNVRNIISGKRMEGGSTITQQVVKIFLLDSQRSLERKIKEAILAYRISNVLSKDKILELYLNQIYLGKGSYGVAAAAKNYFGKSLNELTLDECAFIAGLPKAPSKYDPNKNYEQSLNRRNFVLKRMYEEKYIDKETLEQEIEKHIITRKSDSYDKIEASEYYVNQVKNKVISMFGEEAFFKGGLNIFTNFNTKYHKQTHKAIKSQIYKINMQKYRNSKDTESSESSDLNGGIIVINSKTGQVLSSIGGYDYYASNFDRVVQAKRQLGSTIKTWVYITALLNGTLPNSIVNDSEIEIILSDNKVWKPKNIDDKFLGEMTMREAFERSRNIPTIKLAQYVGMDDITSLINKFKIYNDSPNIHSLILGSVESSLEKISRAYAVIANQCYDLDLHYIEMIKDNHGNVIYKRDTRECLSCDDNKSFKLTDNEKTQVIDQNTCYQITSFLEGALKRRAKFFKGKALAGKTGTTNKSFDTWFVGFSPNLTVGIYIGHDIPKQIGKYAVGANTALPVFIDFIKDQEDIPEKFNMPEGIKLVSIDKKTGNLYNTEESNEMFEEVFKINDNPDKRQYIDEVKDIFFNIKEEEIFNESY